MTGLDILAWIIITIVGVVFLGLLVIALINAPFAVVIPVVALIIMLAFFWAISHLTL